MDFNIRKININDKEEILNMMKDFYSSDAVYTNGSDTIFESDFNNCINQENPFLDGFIFCSDAKTLGYAMVAKSFSTEFGKPCIWLEDMYLKPEFRGNGIIPKFIEFIKRTYPDSVYRLEVEEENTHAVHVYKNLGFKTLPYKEMFYYNTNAIYR